MEYKLKLIDSSIITDDIYEMYQDIPAEEIGSNNRFKGISKDEFAKIMNECILEKNKINPELNTTTNRYIYYVDNKPIGELGIRTLLNEFWINRGSQIFYKIRLSERNKGYGNKLLELALKECKSLGFKRVRINCDDNNLPSKKVILKNGGMIDIKSYKTSTGYSSSYIIEI